MVILAAIAGCSCGHGSATRHRADTTVISVAKRDGEALLKSTNLEADLLRLRGREQLMRDSGLMATADLYIATLEPYVKQRLAEEETKDSTKR